MFSSFEEGQYFFFCIQYQDYEILPMISKYNFVEKKCRFIMLYVESLLFIWKIKEMFYIFGVLLH